MLIALFPSRYPANIAEEVISRTIKERVGGDPEAINAISPTGRWELRITAVKIPTGAADLRGDL